MEFRYIDAHGHMQFPEFDEDREELLEEMRQKGVGSIAIGTDLASSKRAVALAEKYDHIFAAIGQHPTDTDELFDVEAYRELAQSKKVVAVGECGLDFFRSDDIAADREKQVSLFKVQIALAAELGLPLVIHARPSKGTMDAYNEAYELLAEAQQEHPGLRGDMHFFVGDVPTAEKFVKLGFTLSFTAVITFADQYDAVIRTVPLESMLAETDAPYVAPAHRRGKRNDPLAVIDVVERIAELREEDSETVRQTLLASTRELFRLPGAA